MIESNTNSLSRGLRVLSLGVFAPLALAGCGSTGTGASLGGNSSFGLANQGRTYVPSRTISYRSTVTRATPVVKLAKKKLVKKTRALKKVETAKLQKRLPVHVDADKPVSAGKIESRMAMIATDQSARSGSRATKIKKPVAPRKIVWKKKATSHVVASAERSGENIAAIKPAQMVPAKAIPAQISLVEMQKSLDDLSKEAARDAKATQKEQLKRTAKVAKAPVTFGFGQTAHRFSGQQ